MKLDLVGKALKDLDGGIIPDEKDGKPIPLNKLLARILADAGGEDPLKLFELAIALNKDAPVSVDTSDRELIEKVIKASRHTALVKGQLLLELKGIS